MLTLGERLGLGCELPPGITYLRRLPIGGAVGLRQASCPPQPHAAPGTCPRGPREGRAGVRTWLHALPPSAGTTPAAPIDHSSPFPDNGSCGGGGCLQAGAAHGDPRPPHSRGGMLAESGSGMEPGQAGSLP